MFSDDGFAGLSFADFFKNFNKPIVYVYRNARTLVIAYIDFFIRNTSALIYK
jgi:hypothetical protein